MKHHGPERLPTHVSEELRSRNKNIVSGIKAAVALAVSIAVIGLSYRYVAHGENLTQTCRAIEEGDSYKSYVGDGIVVLDGPVFELRNGEISPFDHATFEDAILIAENCNRRIGAELQFSDVADFIVQQDYLRRPNP